MLVSCSESITRRISSKFRPVLAGYVIISLIFLSGPMMNTLCTVKVSLAAGPLLEEISNAKVEYESKMRELLSPEQYERYKDFEMREALEKEWHRYKVEGLEALSLAELKALTQSLEDLGIREKASSTFLPFEPEPSSSNWITPEERDVHQIILKRLSRLDAAEADLEVIAERNQLSDDARQMLAEVITNRRHLLRRQYAASPTPEEARARARARIEAHKERGAK